MDCVPNVKPKMADALVAVGVVDAEETVEEPDGVPVGDDEMEVGSEVAAVDSGVDAEGEVEGKSEPVGIGMVPIVLAASIPTEDVLAVPDTAVAAAQSVADTVTVDTTVTVTMLSVPMTTVGVTIPLVAEEDVVAEVPVPDVILEMELETTDVGLRVGSDDVGTIMEVDEDDNI